MKKSLLILSVSLIVFSLSCKKAVDKTPEAQGKVVLDLPEFAAGYYDSRMLVVPNQNEKATLGRVLFYDTRLSLNNAVSCASCHKQEFAFSDDARFSRGFDNRLTGRNSMAIENMVLVLNGRSVHNDFNSGQSSLFWDGREIDLKNLVARPISNHVEMGIDDPKTLAAKLQGLSYYKDLFKAAYGDEIVTFDRMSESIALFIASIRATQTRFDKMRAKKIEFTAQESMGLNLFHSKYPCGSCHRIDTMGYTGMTIQDIGLDEIPTDKGRGNIFPGTDGMFKAPNLRNVALTAPYMHDGRFNTLEDVIEHYSHGMKNSANLSEVLRGPDGKAMNMNISSEEKAALVAFLKTLTDYNMVTDPKFSNPFKIQ